jgi:hypothetical protein
MAQAVTLSDDVVVTGARAPPGHKNRSSRHARAAFHAADVRALWIGLWFRIAARGVILVWIMTLLGPYATTFYVPFFARYIAIDYG